MSNCNYYKCPHCRKMTRHIQLSEREYASINGESKGEVLGAAFADATGVTYLMNNIIGITSYKCAECGHTSIRNGSGKDITNMEGHATIIEKIIGKQIFPWTK